MKIVRFLVMVVFMVSALFLGFILIWSFLSEKGFIPMPFDVEATVKQMTSAPWNWRLGLALIAVGAGLIMLRVKEMRREQCIAFDNPGGEVAISMDAVEDFIKRAAAEFKGVKSILPRIHAEEEGIGIAIRMDVWSGTNIPRLSEEIQNAVKSRVQDSLGINVSYVGVSVGKIVRSGDEEKGLNEEPL